MGTLIALIGANYIKYNTARYIMKRTLFFHSDNCRLTTICCTIVLSETHPEYPFFPL
jgi:hypothetical protein